MDAIRLACDAGGLGMTSVLVVDNYDSFTYNLVQYLGELGAEVEVVRNDLPELLERSPDRVIVSPGPCTPEEAGLSKDAIRRYAEGGVPVLGVCLGHQALAAAYGGRVVRGEPVHGKTAEAEHDGRTIFDGLESPLVVGRYHSLVVDPELPDELEVSARSGEVIMGLRHRELPLEGVQFHPESVLTPHGKELLRNFLADAERVLTEAIDRLAERRGPGRRPRPPRVLPRSWRETPPRPRPPRSSSPCARRARRSGRSPGSPRCCASAR